MLSWRVTSERQPRTKNGQPPQRTTGAASRSWSASSTRGGTACAMGLPGSISPIATAQQRRREQRAPAEAPRHVDQLWILGLLRGRDARLQRHAADGTVARPLAHDLGVHRAGPAGLGARRARWMQPGRSGPGRSAGCADFKYGPGRRLEPGLAACGAEIDRPALVMALVDRPRGVDGHPADGVYELGRRRGRGLLAPRRRAVKNTRFDEPPRKPADPAAAPGGPHRHRLQPPRRRDRPAHRPHRGRDARGPGGLPRRREAGLRDGSAEPAARHRHGDPLGCRDLRSRAATSSRARSRSTCWAASWPPASCSSWGR